MLGKGMILYYKAVPLGLRRVHDKERCSPSQRNRQESLMFSSPLHRSCKERVATPISPTSSRQPHLSPTIFLQEAMIITLFSQPPPQLPIAGTDVDNTKMIFISGASVGPLWLSLFPSSIKPSNRWDNGSSTFFLFSGGELVDDGEEGEKTEKVLDCWIHMTLLEQSIARLEWFFIGARLNFISFMPLWKISKRENNSYILDSCHDIIWI